MAREKRFDSHRRVLKAGEYERRPGLYEYKWREVEGYTKDGKKIYKQRAMSAETLDELRAMEQRMQKDKRLCGH